MLLCSVTSVLTQNISLSLWTATAAGRRKEGCLAWKATAAASKARGNASGPPWIWGSVISRFFSFSSENWKRPPREVEYLMGLLRRFIRRDLAELHQNNIKVRVIGSEEGVPPDLLTMFRDAVALTSGNTGLQLIIAFNYGARDEIVRAAKRLAQRVESGELEAESITQDTLAEHFDTVGIPDPDLLIRTSGEQRISNFLLWQCAYAEFLFVDNFWPDFTRQTLESAIASYQQRERRFGGLAG